MSTRHHRDLTFEEQLKREEQSERAVPVLWKRIDVMKHRAHDDWLRSLGKNGFEHSKKIEEYMDRLVPDHIKKEFNSGEIFVLLFAAYLHDIGLLKGRLEERKDHENRSYEYIVKNFEKYGLENEFEAKAVAMVCRGHAPEEERPLSTVPSNHGVESLCREPLNLRFLAALLRLADELDNAYTRVIGLPGEMESMRHLVGFVNIDVQRWSICFQTNPTDINEWEKLAGMRSYTEGRLRELIWVLESLDLLYDRIELEPKWFPQIEVAVDGVKKTYPIQVSADECAAGKCQLNVTLWDTAGQEVKTNLPKVGWLCRCSDSGPMRGSSRAYKDEKARTPSDKANQSAVCPFMRTTAGTWKIQAKLSGEYEIQAETVLKVNQGEIHDSEILPSQNFKGRIQNEKLIVPKWSKVVFGGVGWDKHGNIGPIPKEIANRIRISIHKR